MTTTKRRRDVKKGRSGEFEENNDDDVYGKQQGQECTWAHPISTWYWWLL
jgi:hypothetical protein